MKFPKFVILVGGLIGLLAFFLPLVAVKDSGVEGALSAYRIVKGIDKASDVVDSAHADETMDQATFASAKEETNSALSAAKGIVLAVFAPALLLAIIGGVAVQRKKMGRMGGTFALIFGLIGLGIWAFLNAAANQVAAEAATGSVKGMGMHLLMLTGLAGAVGGLITLIKPDRGPAAVA